MEKTLAMEKTLGIYGAPRGHWVGDGFPVRSLFTYDRLGAQHLSPFLLFADFQAGKFGKPRGT